MDAVAHYVVAPCLRGVTDEFRQALDLAFDMWRYNISFWIRDDDLDGDVILCERWTEE